jgi:transposase
MAPQAPRLDSLHVPLPEGSETLKIAPYGIGVDCHSRFYQICLLVREPASETGALRYDWDCPADIPSLSAARSQLLELLALHGIEVTVGTLAYTCESSGPYHKPLLNAWGGRPSVVNPLLAGSTRRKTDVLDARLLAYQAMTGLWPSTYTMPPEYEQCRHWLRAHLHWKHVHRIARQKIVTLTTMYGHTVASEGPVVRADVRALIEDLANGRAKAHPKLHPKGVPPAVGELIHEWYRVADDSQMRAADAWRRAKGLIDEQRYLIPLTGELVLGKELVRLLRTIPGVGEMSAYTLVAETGDIARFPNAKAYTAFCGFDPSLKVSAGKVTAHVRRRGNAQINRALRSAVTTLITRRTEPFGQWAYIVMRKNKKGGFRKAASALARRCCMATFHCWWRGEEFSYRSYRLDLSRDVANEAVADAAQLSLRVKKMLAAAGYETSSHVSAKLAEVYALPGMGTKAKEELERWLSWCKDRSLAGHGGSSKTAAASST